MFLAYNNTKYRLKLAVLMRLQCVQRLYCSTHTVLEGCRTAGYAHTGCDRRPHLLQRGVRFVQHCELTVNCSSPQLVLILMQCFTVNTCILLLKREDSCRFSFLSLSTHLLRGQSQNEFIHLTAVVCGAL